MALITPKGPSWGYTLDNDTGTPADGTIGTSVTAGANNAMGTAVQLLAALSYDVEYVRIGIAEFGTSGADGSTLLDILIDPAGGTTWASEPLIPYLLAGFTDDYRLALGQGLMQWYDFPVFIPAGASIGAQAQTAHSSTLTGIVYIEVRGANQNPEVWWCGRKVTAVGITSASSIGTSHTTGNGTLSAWADLGSTLPARCGAVQWAAQGPAGTAAAAHYFRFQLGVGDVQIGPSVRGGLQGVEVGMRLPTGIIFADIAEGAQLRVRGIGSSASAVDVAAYVVH
jgi:hypothetical protein